MYVAVPDAVALAPEGNLLAVAVYPYSGRNLVIPTAPAAMIGLAASSGVRIVRGPYLAAPVEAHAKTRMNVVWETDLPATGKVVVEPAQPETAATAGQAARSPRRVGATRGRRARARDPTGRRAQRTRPRVELPLSRRDRGCRRRHGRERAGALRDAARAARAAALRRLRRHALPGARGPPRRGRGAGARSPGAGDQHRRSHRRGQPRNRTGSGTSTSPRRWARSRPSFPCWATTTPPAAARARSRRGSCSTCRSRRRRSTRRSSWAAFTSSRSTPTTAASAQRDWLQDDLARARRHHARAVFAFCHEPPWSHGLHGDSHRMIRDYAPLLVAGHVDALFCGHDHIYERGAGATPKGKLTYIVTGGGGAPLYNPRCQAASGPPPGDVPGPLPPCPPLVAVLTKTLPLRHRHGRRRQHPALPQAPGRLCGRAVRRASTPSTVSAVPVINQGCRNRRAASPVRPTRRRRPSRPGLG